MQTLSPMNVSFKKSPQHVQGKRFIILNAIVLKWGTTLKLYFKNPIPFLCRKLLLKEEREKEISSTHFVFTICKQRNNVKQTNLKWNSPTNLCYDVKDLF